MSTVKISTDLKTTLVSSQHADAAAHGSHVIFDGNVIG